jgi:hypothetical protein
MTEQTGADQALVAVLKDIAAREGGAILSNRRRLIGLLRDKLPEETRAIRMALTAYDAGVPARLRAHPSLGDVEVAQESHRVSNDTGLSDSFARSAVVAWAQALTDYTPQEATASPAPAPAAPIPPAPSVQAQPAVQPLPPQMPPAVQPVPVAPVQPLPQSVPPLPPPPVQSLGAPSVQPLPGAGAPPPPVQPYTGAYPGGGPLPPNSLPAQSLAPSAAGKMIKFAALAVIGVGVLAVAGLASGVLQPGQFFRMAGNSPPASPRSTPPTSAPATPAAPKRTTVADGTALIGGGRYPTIQTQHEAGNILTFKFATEDGGDTSYAAAIRYQGTDGGTGAIVAVRNGQTASTGNVPLRRWLSGTDQSVVVSGNLANNTGNVRSACVFATLSKNTSVPETAPGKSFCAYGVKPDGQCDIEASKSLGCATLK